MAGINEPLPVKTIAKVLKVYPRLREKFDVISGTDGERDLCQSSSDNLKQAGNSDNES
jgi:hypothetical protein